MDSMGGMSSRAEGAGSSSRGVHDGASEASGPGGLLGDPPHVEGRARMSTRVRGTASDGGGGCDGLPFPPSDETATRGRERVSPRVLGPLGGGGQDVPPHEKGQYDGRARRARPAGLPHTPLQVSGDGVPQGALKEGACSAALQDSLDAFISPLHERLSFLETALGASRRSRRRRLRLSSSPSDGEYSGGGGGRHVPRRAVARALGRELEGDSHRGLPEKIVPVDDRYAVILDFFPYALANTGVRYDRTMAHGLGRLRKDVSATIGREAEWDGTPALGVVQFLNRFVKAGNDNDVPEARALYLLPEFTMGDLKRELYTIMPSLQGGRSGKVSSYMEPVNWLLRKYADEQSLSDQNALVHGASQEDGESENDFYVRLRGLRRLCGYIHTEGQMKSHYMQGLGWEIRADVREYITGNMPMDLLVQYAQRKGDACRRCHEEQQAEEARRAEDRRGRRATRPTPRKYVTAAMTAPTKVGEVPACPSSRGKGRFGQPRNYNCLACNMRGHFFRECPRLDAATKALLNKAYEELMAERPQEEQRRPKQTVEAVGTSLGPPWSSSDDTPPPRVVAEELVQEDKSSSENE